MNSFPPRQFNINNRRLTSLILIQFSGSIIAQGMVAAVMLLTARQVGPIQYGQYVGSLTLVTFTSILFNLGLDLWLLREGGRDPAATGNLAGSVLVIKGSIGLLWLLVMFILAGFIDSQSLPANFIRWNSLIILFDSLFITTLTAFKATLRNSVNAAVEALSDTLWLIVTITLISFGVTQVLPFLQSRFVIIVLSVMASALLLRQLLNTSASVSTIQTALRQCFPYAASEFLTRVIMRVDVLMVSIFLGGYAVGIYSPVVSITNALFVIPATVHTVMLPVMSNLFSQNITQGWRLARKNLILMTVIGIVLSVGVYFGAWVLPSFLGKEYAQTRLLLQMLSIIPLLHSVSFGMAGILVATNQQKRRSTIQAFSAISNVFLNLAVINWAGIQGVAAVYIISDLILLVGYTWYVVKIYRQPYKLLT